MAKAEFFFDVGSPAAYLAATQVDALAQRAKASIQWRPMLLGGVFQATGNRAPAVVAAKGAWLFGDLQRHAKIYGVDFHRNPFFPVNTLQLMRAAAGLEAQGRLRPFADIAFRGIWAEKQNLGEAKILADYLACNGFDPDEILALAQDQGAKDRLRATTEEAVERGCFGAPTFFVGEEMFFGQDRLAFVERALNAQAGEEN